jgi:hypothetical protein
MCLTHFVSISEPHSILKQLQPFWYLCPVREQDIVPQTFQIFQHI